MFKGIFGLNLVHVPYKGSAPALNDLVGGHIQMMFCDVPPARALIESGKIRALGVTTKERVPAVKELRPLAEAGVPGYDTASWHTVTTTGGVPQPIVDKLSANIREIMGDPAVTEALVKDGALPQVSPSPEEMKRFVASEIVRWGEVVTQAGLAGSE
jgi:tripartite-type tricarboxylate transporter receptor subunit TctC